jgi:MFS family permease
MTRSQLITAVYLPTVLLALGQGILLATLPLYAESFGRTYVWVSFAVSAAALGTLVTDVPAGALLSRIGLRRAMILGSGLVTVATIAVVFTEGYGLFVILRVVAGIGTALWGLSRHALIAESIHPSQRGRAISVFGGINRIGVFGGPAVGGFIGTAYGLQAPFLFAGLLAAVALAMAIFVIPARVSAPPAISFGQRWSVVGSLIRTNGRDLSAASVAQVFAQMIRQGRQFIVPLYGAQQIGLDVAQIGLIMTSAALLDVAMFFPAGVVMDRFGRKVAAVPSFAVMAIGVSLIPLANSFTGLMAAAVIIGFGNGLGSGTMMTLGADLAPKGATGEFLGIWRLIGDVGQVGGPLIVGTMAGVLGLANSAFALAVVGVAAALTLSFLVQETRHSPLEVAT